MAKITGTVRNGMVIPDEPLDVADGTTVLVEIPARDWLARFAGIWRDDAGIEAFAREWPESRSASAGPEL